MTYLVKGTKGDILKVMAELGLESLEEQPIKVLIKTITSSDDYDEKLTKGLFKAIVDSRKELEEGEKQRKLEERQREVEERERQRELEERRREFEERERQRELEERERMREMKERQMEREFELERLRIETAGKTQVMVNQGITHGRDLTKILSKYDMKEDMSLYLTLFERQVTLLSLDRNMWVSHLLCLVPQEIAQIIAREPADRAADYDHVKSILLQRFRLTPERFRQLFHTHYKANGKNWRDFQHELTTYFVGWISGCKVQTIEQLMDLIITDQMKKRTPEEFKTMYLKEWTEIKSPAELVVLLERFEDVQQDSTFPVARSRTEARSRDQYSRGGLNPQRDRDNIEGIGSGRQPLGMDREFDRRAVMRCYHCNEPGHIRPDCPRWRKPTNEIVNRITETEDPESILLPYSLQGKINGRDVNILRDTGATIDIVCQKLVSPTDLTGEHVWVQQPLDAISICLPVAEVMVECEWGRTTTKAAVIPDSLDKGRYLLGNRTAALFHKNSLASSEHRNVVVTINQKNLEETFVPDEQVRTTGEVEVEVFEECEEFLPAGDDREVAELSKVDIENLEKKTSWNEVRSSKIRQIDEEISSKDFKLVQSRFLVRKKKDKTGWLRLLLTFCCAFILYSSILLGTRWTMPGEKYEEYRVPSRYPYPMIAIKTFWTKMRIFPSFEIGEGPFGVSTVLLVFSSELLRNWTNGYIPLCLRILIVTGCLCPTLWLGMLKIFGLAVC